MFKFKSGKEVTDSVGLLITLLVRYPEIAKINYEPENQLIKMSFLIKSDVNENVISKFVQDLKSSILTFNYLEQVDNIELLVNYEINDDCISIDIYRDINTITSSEISLIVQLFQKDFSNSVIADSNEFFYEDELVWQEELISDMLENLKKSNPVKKLLAFRDDGKVRVFDK